MSEFQDLSMSSPKNSFVSSISCPLCGALAAARFQDDPFRRCSNCLLIFKDRRIWPSSEEERERYLRHENHGDNPGYLNYLRPALDGIEAHVPKGSRGLDFGCGPGPVLARQLEEKGYQMEIYDPFFFPTWPEGPFDFVVATEVIEHLHSPRKALEKMFSVLSPKGPLLLMTQVWTEGRVLKGWSYARDKTHVCIYTEASLRYLAQEFGRELKSLGSHLYSLGL